jgi:hypothetical protein
MTDHIKGSPLRLPRTRNWIYEPDSVFIVACGREDLEGKPLFPSQVGNPGHIRFWPSEQKPQAHHLRFLSYQLVPTGQPDVSYC